MTPGAFVVGAELVLRTDCDPAAVGAAVTAELCGHWEHDGPCRWPHNNAIDDTQRPARFRTLFVADPQEAAVVEDRIRAALHSGQAWDVLAVERVALDKRDEALAQRLLAGRRADPG